MDSQHKSMMVDSIHFIAWFSLIGGIFLGVVNGNVIDPESFEEYFSFIVFFTYTSYGAISFILFAALGKAMILLEDIREFSKEQTEYLKIMKKNMEIKED